MAENSTLKKTKIMASCPITSWQIDGETMETVTDYFLGSKIIADSDCSHEIKICLLQRSNRQRINLKNIQATPPAQLQKNKMTQSKNGPKN